MFVFCWICQFMSLVKFGVFLTLVFWIPFYLHPLSLILLGLWWHGCYIFCYSPTDPRGSFFSSLFPLCYLRFCNFYSRIFKITDFLNVSFILLLNPSTEIFISSIVLLSYKISNWFSFIFSLSLLRLFFTCSKCAHNCLLKHLIIATLKSLSGNFTIFFILMLAFIDCLFPFILRFS